MLQAQTEEQLQLFPEVMRASLLREAALGRMLRCRNQAFPAGSGGKPQPTAGGAAT